MYLLLKEKVYTNNSIFFPSEIGEAYRRPNDALQCITDLKPCCRTDYYVDLDMMNYRRPGNWFFPNGTEVSSYSNYSRNYGISPVLSRHRQSSGNINLNHNGHSAIAFPTGLYCCITLDANRTNKTLCAVIGRYYYYTI